MSIERAFLVGTLYAWCGIIHCEMQRGRELPLFPDGWPYLWATACWPLSVPVTLYRRVRGWFR